MLRPRLHDALTRSLAVLAATVALLLAALPGAARADDAQVTVATPGGNERTLALAALAGNEDVVERTYSLATGSGESTAVITGFSPAALIEAAGADPYGFSYLEVQRPAGGSVLLSRDQALNAGAFADGPPVVYVAPGGTGFLRPSTGPGDANASDSFVAPQGVTLVLRKGSPLLVEIESSTLRTEPGRPVSFKAIVERSGAGEQLSYSWYFDDGHAATGAKVRHAFEKRGSYDVVVGVTTPGDRAGASAVVTIQVGAPLSGPDRKGGGRVRVADAPDHGAATGTRGAVPPGPGSSPAATAPPRPEARSRKPRPAPEGEPVSGLLLSDAEPTAPRPTAAAARSGHLSDGGGGPGLSDAALGVLTTLSLLGAGALIETRNLFR